MEEIINRQKYFNKIKPFIGKDIIKVIVGQRRVGKSKMLLLIMDFLKNHLGVPENQIIFIDKENIKFDYIIDYNQLYDITKDYKYIFCDEIQNIKEWERAVLTLQNQGKDVYITGSNSNIFSSSIATNLRGRYIKIEIYPLSYPEFLIFHKLDDNIENFYKYIDIGGLPYLAKLPFIKLVIDDYLKNITDTIILHDIVERFNVRNIGFFNNLLKFSALNIGNIFSSTNISAFIKAQKQKISPTTILDYIEYLKQAYVINECPRYDIKGKSIFEIKQKYFFTDVGIRNSIVGGYKKSDIGGILENVVFMALKSNNRDIKTGQIKDKEIDFIAEKNGNIIYIQVAYIIEKKETLQREISSLEIIKDNWDKYLISMDNYAENEKINGINLMNIKDFVSKIENL